MNKVKSYSLSDSDIRDILGDISIITYPELAQMESIDECFDSKGRCILLFLTSSPTSGHWCCMLNKKDKIVFFDPYGDAPEKQKEGANPALLEQMDQRQPHLTDLMRASGRPVYYNTYDYQKEGYDVNTCGRWCVARCLYASKSDEYFHKLIMDAEKKGIPPDEFVSALTANWLRK